jgi:DNA-binding response OmpR family regulator
VIAIVSSNTRERMALAALCEQCAWAHEACDSWRAFRNLSEKIAPEIVVTRHKLVDGYSDDILALVGRDSRVIVLYPADLPPSDATRQIGLGADCVLRDPVRTDLLSAYIAQYITLPALRRPRQPAQKSFRFAGALIDPVARTVEHGGTRAPLAPREVELVKLLSEGGEAMISYQNLYNEILRRPFRGDTSNMRVLLGKLDASFRRVGIALREFVAVIPKAGYRCRGNPRSARRLARDGTAGHPSAA